MKIIENKKALLLSVLSGIIVALAFTFEKISLFMWIGFIPLIYVFINYTKTYKEALRCGFIFGNTYYLIILHWIFNLYPLDWIDISKEQSIIILIGGWIFISIVEGLIIGILLGLLYLIKSKNNLINIITFGALWVVIEWVQGLGVLGFPWGRIAISQVSNLSLVQSASLLGSLFVGLIIIIFNGLITLAFMNRNKTKGSWQKYVAIALSIFIFNMAYGMFKMNQNSSSDDVEVVIVQGNIPTAQKWKSGATREHLYIYTSLTESGVAKHKEEGKETKIVFWPETAVPLNLSQSNWVLSKYVDLAVNNNVTLAVGAFHSETKDIVKDYNSIYFINEKGEVKNIYFKRQLVPFGEMLPYADVIYKIIPILEEANLFNGDLHSGEEAKIANTNYGKIGSVICFESIFPNLILDNIREGAELIFVATNDSWFKDSKAVYQHNNNSVLRTIETNRYVVRAANTGISSVINNKGEIIDSLSPLVQGCITSEVKFIKENTLYTKVGDIIVLISSVCIVIVSIKRIKT